jgi:CcmD family protein
MSTAFYLFLGFGLTWIIISIYIFIVFKKERSLEKQLQSIGEILKEGRGT